MALHPPHKLPVSKPRLAILTTCLLALGLLSACEPVPESAVKELQGSASGGRQSATSANTSQTGNTGNAASSSSTAGKASSGSNTAPRTATANSGSKSGSSSGSSGSTQATSAPANADASGGGRLGPIARNQTATAQAKAGGASTSATARPTTAAVAAVRSTATRSSSTGGSQNAGPTATSRSGSYAGSQPTATRTPIPAGASVGSGAGASGSGSAPARGTATDVPVADPAGYVGRSATLGESGGRGTVSAIRYGAHPEGGYTRLVWDLSTTMSLPLVNITEKSDSAGSFIRLVFDNCTLGSSAAASLPLDLGAGSVIERVELAPDGNTSHLVFEVRLARPARFQAGALDAPDRVVLDVYE